MSILIYYDNTSPYVRAVRLTVEYLKLENRVEYKHLDLLKGDNLSDDYKKINPRRVVPFLIDGNVRINESRAITIYLVSKYGNGAEPLYPLNNINEIAKINEMLFFDAADFLLDSFSAQGAPQFYGVKREEWAVNRQARDFEYLSSILNKSKFICFNDRPTLADYSLASAISMYYAYDDFDIKTEAPEIHEYYLRMCGAVPNFAKLSDEGISLLKALIKAGREARA